MEQAIREMEKRHDKAMARVLRIIEKRERALKFAVTFCITIVALGCAIGILTVNNLSQGRRHDSCWTGFNNSLVLRGLIKVSGAEIKFQSFVNKTLVLPKCPGKDPNPPPPIIQQLGK